jgi:signal transduction histidine kinase
MLVTLLVALAATAAALGTMRQLRRTSGELRDAHDRLHCMDELLDAWQWQTDVEHRMLLLRPPSGAAVADWSAAATGLPLWEQFRVDQEAALRARLASHAPLDDLTVQRQSAVDGPRSYRLRGRIRTDAMGRFTGYHGTLRESAAQPATSTPALEADHSASTTIEVAMAPVSDVELSGSDHETFSFTVSHDLRAPIRVVEGFTKIVKEDYGRLLDRVGNDHLDRVLGAAARMNNMIDALLALAKLSSQPLARQPVNLSQLATYVSDDLRRQAPDRDVQIDIEPGLLVQGDPTLLRVVVENLLGNAWKYSAKAARPHIVFERHAGDPDTFTMRDNGAGFDMRFADRLFGVFQRLHSATDFPGTGVGLASVRRIVRRHGGEIWGEAAVNQGARFHFSLAP